MPGGATPASARGQRPRPLDEVLASFEEQGVDVIDLHEALECLAETNPRPGAGRGTSFLRRAVHPRGRATLGVSDATVETDWRFARAWLRGQLGGSEP